MKIKFKEREVTKYLRIHIQDCKGMTYDALYRQHRQAGDFHIDAHFYIDRLGIVSKGRDIGAVAGVGVPENEVSIYVLVDNISAPNDLQYASIKDLVAELLCDYPKIKQAIERG